MLFDPFEKQFDLPPAPIQLGDRQCGQREIVGQEDQRFACLRVFEPNSPQRLLEILVSVESREDDRLVANKARTAIDWMRVTPLCFEIRFAADDKEASGLVQSIKAREIGEAAIHDVESTDFRHQLVEDVDFVKLAVADVNKARDIAAQIEQRMHFHGCFGRAKRRPGKHRQTQVDSRGIERVNRILQIDAKRIVGVERSRYADQALREIGVDAPVANCIGIGERVARHRRANAEVIQLGLLRSQTGFDIAQTFSEGQLRKGHAKKLIQARKRFYFVFAAVARHDSAKRMQREMLHELRENQLARVHGLAPRLISSQGRKLCIWSSSR